MLAYEFFLTPAPKVSGETADSLRQAEVGSRALLKGGTMTVGSISAASLSQSAYASSNSNQLNQILQTVQDGLSSGDLNNAQSAFQTLQSLFQDSASTTGASLSSNSQLSTDMASLGSALSSGDLPTAQSAFATVVKDLKTSSSPSLSNETTAASQSLQLVNGLLSSLNTSASTDSTTNMLESYYSSKSGLNVLG